ncbi:hypothetical protein PF010_g19678 [Phytophthora fragariae]|uniref:Uncharacterized protein n=1 Tax=Phytophthora fragariae TaxID=53985 RepID=A0A6A3R1M2_9STRA|nr:hypothetical protein PF003_g29632 [Phytophthora fragariae]KAE8933153.1 hypothetical protein PF009_g16833 [Phytophthora fragariae]KAE9087564.1 hypothetical protein PF007_g20327 [Phytophthora fragariae]KAE9087585.1 hypothetical protein PF010_g19678 [Phytophthora fragariae]KAE9125589.1 hypothetical protein PF006_g16928 [Phytophthora fragariae]
MFTDYYAFILFLFLPGMACRLCGRPSRGRARRGKLLPGYAPSGARSATAVAESAININASVVSGNK